MSKLEWLTATSYQRTDLQGFRCARPPSRVAGHPFKKFQPRPWEDVVERQIHGLEPSCGPHEVVRLGYDSEGLAAVAVAVQNSDPGFVIIEGIAVALRCRDRGFICADEALSEAEQWALARADVASLPDVLISAKISPENAASRHLLTRNGFFLFERTAVAETWNVNLPVPARSSGGSLSGADESSAR